MAIFISRRQVFNNLLRFKQGLSGKMEASSQDKRIYKAMLNFQTGDIQFPLNQSLNTNPSEWMDIEVEVKQGVGSESFFAAKDLNNRPLDSQQMAPIAWRIMVETIQALNAITAQHPQSNLIPEQAVIKGIDDEVSSFKSIEGISGWMGKLDRFEAEKNLLLQPVGTYLLRNGDGFTEVIAQNLMEGNQLCVEVFVCTVVEPEDKISDSLILMTDKGWTLYRDNPDLSDLEYKYCNSPQALLSQFGERLKQPVA